MREPRLRHWLLPSRCGSPCVHCPAHTCKGRGAVPPQCSDPAAGDPPRSSAPSPFPGFWCCLISTPNLELITENSAQCAGELYPEFKESGKCPSAFLPTGGPQRGQLLRRGPSKSSHPHSPELPPGVKLWCPPQDFAEIKSLLGSFPSQAGLPPDSLIRFSQEHFL